MTYSTYDTEMPWIVYHYGRTHDRWWPPFHSSRWLGYAIIECECAVCGVREALKMRLPRFGAVPEPEGGQHPKRLRFKYAHLHPDRPHPMAWAKPLLNLAAHQGGIDLKLLAARLERDRGWSAILALQRRRNDGRPGGPARPGDHEGAG